MLMFDNPFLSHNTTGECGVPQGPLFGPVIFLLLINNLRMSISGCQDDDGRGDNLRRLLAAIRPIFHRSFLLANHHELPIRPRNLLGHILVSDEQLNVQSHNILLDERQVRNTMYISISRPTCICINMHVPTTM